MSTKPLDLAQFEGHTPGEWLLSAKLSGSENHKGFRLHDENGYWIADVMPRDEDGVEGKANGMLLAYAPELLAELRERRAQIEALMKIGAEIVKEHDAGEPRYLRWAIDELRTLLAIKGEST